MTKTKALEQMLEFDRHLIDPSFARKIAKAFGYTLTDLGLKPKKTKDYYRVNHSKETAELSSIATYDLARSIALKGIDTLTEDEKLELAKKFNSLTYTTCESKDKQWLEFNITSPLHGAGSSAQWITEKSVEIIKATHKANTQLGCGIHNNWGMDK